MVIRYKRVRDSESQLYLVLFQTPYMYRGVRMRSKEDFSLRMYSDEVKVSSYLILKALSKIITEIQSPVVQNLMKLLAK